MIQPKEIEVTGVDGTVKTFKISKVPATVGREIVAKYPVSMIPKIGDYEVSESIMVKMMQFVSVVDDNGNEIALKTKTLIDNHVTDWEMLASLEVQMLNYNTSFLASGKGSKLLDGFAKNIQEWITKILTDLSLQSSPKEKPHSKN